MWSLKTEIYLLTNMKKGAKSLIKKIKSWQYKHIFLLQKLIFFIFNLYDKVLHPYLNYNSYK